MVKRKSLPLIALFKLDVVKVPPFAVTAGSVSEYTVALDSKVVVPDQYLIVTRPLVSDAFRVTVKVGLVEPVVSGSLVPEV